LCLKIINEDIVTNIMEYNIDTLILKIIEEVVVLFLKRIPCNG
jgi:hypothetical protein